MSSRALIFRSMLLALALVAVVSCGSDDAATTTVSSTAPVPAASALVSVDEFAHRIDTPGVVTINVHVPDEGNIAGTDLVIPYDEIADSTELPVELDTPLATATIAIVLLTVGHRLVDPAAATP